MDEWEAEKLWREIEMMREKMTKVKDDFLARGMEGIMPAKET